jgi:hypothetical protein
VSAIKCGSNHGHVFSISGRADQKFTRNIALILVGQINACARVVRERGDELESPQEWDGGEQEI